MVVKKTHIPDARESVVYRKSLVFKKEIYKLVKGLPAYESGNMVDQLIRCSSSVVANLREGMENIFYGKEFDRLNTSLGSIAECRAFLDMAVMEEGYLSKEKYHRLDKEAETIYRLILERMFEIDRILSGTQEENVS
ncbi:four helix bundle protein [Neobacillus drentensis]|uniref:four helix bundle protein n=1 Tax=Neobacillus drentensis TaxID=220684 RepID=UPI0030009D72